MGMQAFARIGREQDQQQRPRIEYPYEFLSAHFLSLIHILFLLVLFWILSTQLLEPLYTRHIERQLTTQAENVVSQLDDALAEGTTCLLYTSRCV